jgi:hypothetical protein
MKSRTVKFLNYKRSLKDTIINITRQSQLFLHDARMAGMTLSLNI